MSVYRITFIKNRIFSCDLANVNINQAVSYEEKRGYLVYAYIRATEMDEAITIANYFHFLLSLAIL